MIIIEIYTWTYRTPGKCNVHIIYQTEASLASLPSWGRYFTIDAWGFKQSMLKNLFCLASCAESIKRKKNIVINPDVCCYSRYICDIFAIWDTFGAIYIIATITPTIAISGTSFLLSFSRQKSYCYELTETQKAPLI